LLIDLTEDQVICYGDSLLLSAQITGGSGIYRIEWPLLAHTDPEVMVNPLSATTYVVNVYEECGLFSSAQVEIDVEPTLADIVVTNEGIDDWQFDAATYPEPIYYFWNLGDGTKASTQQVSHSYTDMEDHWVHLEIVTANGCRATDSVYIIPPAQIHFPNAFTPGRRRHQRGLRAGEPHGVLLRDDHLRPLGRADLRLLGRGAGVGRQGERQHGAHRRLRVQVQGRGPLHAAAGRVTGT
jgi:hypothetical protein